ncbi:hypothetical protein EON65_32570 [archaeon]|nr:MAG: hypothetical protein EON65_32570 [archaeon]
MLSYILLCIISVSLYLIHPLTYFINISIDYHCYYNRIESKGITVIESIIGFGVVIDPKHSAFVATTNYPTICYSRLSKEEVVIADKPLSLLETMPLTTYFRKFLTRKHPYMS